MGAVEQTPPGIPDEHPDIPGSRIRLITLQGSPAAVAFRKARGSHWDGRMEDPGSSRVDSRVAEAGESVPKSEEAAAPHPEDGGEGELVLRIVEDIANNGPAGRVWDASIVLAEHLLGRFGTCGLVDCSAIELGAGAGLPGIVAAIQGARVILTDKAFVLPLMDANATLNAPEHVASGLLWAEPILWGQRLRKGMRRHPPDLLLAADVVGCGDEALFPGLIKSMTQIAGPSSTILMAYKPRARSPSHSLLLPLAWILSRTALTFTSTYPTRLISSPPPPYKTLPRFINTRGGLPPSSSSLLLSSLELSDANVYGPEIRALL